MTSSTSDTEMRELLSPLLERPRGAALVFDIDGTLAPIVSRPEDARVPERAARLLRELEGRYGLVACVSGRRALDARRVVGVPSIAYVGNHGLELLRPGAGEIETAAEVAAAAEAVRAFARRAYGEGLRRAGVRLEDKHSIWSFHWRGAADEARAESALEDVAEAAEGEGLVPHWGRKVLEIRPPLPVDKGTALASVLDGSQLRAALYGGDDTTDLDAFRALRAMRSDGRLEAALCVGVRSTEGPPAIAAEADVVVEGTDGFAELLAALAD